MTGWSWKLGRVAGIDDAGGSGERTDADRRGPARRGGHDIALRLRGALGEGAVQRLRASDCPAQPVLRDRELVGVLTMENGGELLTVHSALRDNKARATSVA